MFFGDVQLVPLSLDFIIQISQWWPFVRPGPPAKNNAMFTLDLSVKSAQISTAGESDAWGKISPKNRKVSPLVLSVVPQRLVRDRFQASFLGRNAKSGDLTWAYRTKGLGPTPPGRVWH